MNILAEGMKERGKQRKEQAEQQLSLLTQLPALSLEQKRALRSRPDVLAQIGLRIEDIPIQPKELFNERKFRNLWESDPDAAARQFTKETGEDIRTHLQREGEEGTDVEKFYGVAPPQRYRLPWPELDEELKKLQLQAIGEGMKEAAKLPYEREKLRMQAEEKAKTGIFYSPETKTFKAEKIIPGKEYGPLIPEDVYKAQELADLRMKIERFKAEIRREIERDRPGSEEKRVKDRVLKRLEAGERVEDLSPWEYNLVFQSPKGLSPESMYKIAYDLAMKEWDRLNKEDQDVIKDIPSWIQKKADEIYGKMTGAKQPPVKPPVKPGAKPRFQLVE
jgi:hypothetical protein